MPEQGFLRRWARRKTEVREGREPLPEPALAPDAAIVVAAAVADPAPQPSTLAPAPESEPATRPLPTLDDVAALNAESDFSAFVARGVDQAVRRSALKKLFADPHFNAIDRLDVYMDDFTKPSPVSEAMLASLEHAKSVFMKLVDGEPEAESEPGAIKLEQPPEQETQ